MSLHWSQLAKDFGDRKRADTAAVCGRLAMTGVLQRGQASFAEVLSCKARHVRMRLKCKGEASRLSHSS